MTPARALREMLEKKRIPLPDHLMKAAAAVRPDALSTISEASAVKLTTAPTRSR